MKANIEKIQYTIVLKSMLSPRAGSLQLQIHEITVTGILEILGHRNRFSGMVLRPDKYLISGSMSTSVEKMEYDAVLLRKGERISGGVVTEVGCWELEGFLTVKNLHGRIKEENKRK